MTEREENPPLTSVISLQRNNSAFASGSHWYRIGVALRSHWGSFGVALGSQWGAYRLATNTLWGGFDVALMSH